MEADTDTVRRGHNDDESVSISFLSIKQHNIDIVLAQQRGTIFLPIRTASTHPILSYHTSLSSLIIHTTSQGLSNGALIPIASSYRTSQGLQTTLDLPQIVKVVGGQSLAAKRVESTRA
jgi:hypothetical protein